MQTVHAESTGKLDADCTDETDNHTDCSVRSTATEPARRIFVFARRKKTASHYSAFFKNCSHSAAPRPLNAVRPIRVIAVQIREIRVPFPVRSE